MDKIETTDIFKEFATDTKAEIEGAWVPFGKGKILIARMGNRKYARRMAELIEQNQEVLGKKDTEAEIAAADAKADEITATVWAETILLGWDENINYKGKPYSFDVAKEALAHTDFRRRIGEESAKFDHFRAKQEEAQGNA